MRTKRRKSSKSKPTSRQMSSSQFYKGRMTIAGSERARASQQKEYRRKKLSKQKRDARTQTFKSYLKWLGAFAILAIVINGMQIRTTQVVSTDLSEADIAELSSTVDDYLGGGPFGRNKLLLNEGNLADYIKRNESFVADVRVSSGLFSTTLTIEAAVKSPVFNYLVTGQDSSPFWLSSDGTLIELKNEQLTGQDLPKLRIRDNSGVDYNSGEQILSSSAVSYIRELTDSLEREGHSTSIVVLETSPREYRIVFSNKKYDLLVSSERPVAAVVNDLMAVIGTAGGRSAENYIDLRVVDKAFVR